MYSNHLENLRNELNLTKKELADILGVSNSIYARWEKNTDSIPTRRLIQIANYFNINIDYILNLTNNKIAIKSNNINYDLMHSQIVGDMIELSNYSVSNKNKIKAKKDKKGKTSKKISKTTKMQNKINSNSDKKV